MSRRVLTGIVVVLVAFLSFCLVPIGGVVSAGVIHYGPFPSPGPDVNDDGRVDIIDLVLLGQHWGETGTPGWIPQDVKVDDVINVLDMVVIGQHWTGPEDVVVVQEKLFGA